MNAFRMLLEARRRLNKEEDKRIGLMINGRSTIMIGVIKEINQLDDYVEFITTSKLNTKPHSVFISLRDVIGVDLPQVTNEA